MLRRAGETGRPPRDVGGALILGVLGYHFIAGFNWVDVLLNAAMILSGMEPAGALNSDPARLFASAYPPCQEWSFITAAGILLAPVFH